MACKVKKAHYTGGLSFFSYLSNTLTNQVMLPVKKLTSALIFFVSWFAVIQISAQGIGIGASAIYNFQSQGKGIGLRAHIPAGERWTIVPQAVWFPPFNIVNEYFAGVNIHYNLIDRERITGYLAAGGHINIWANASESPYVKAKTFNVMPEVSGGLIFGAGCFRPFAEHRYNPIWKEGSTHIGILWFPRCSASSGRSVDRCPAYN